MIDPANERCETVKVKDGEDYRIINRADYDAAPEGTYEILDEAAVMTLDEKKAAYEAAKAAKAAKAAQAEKPAE